MESSDGKNLTECIITWEIENFYYSPHKFGEAIESPEFFTDNFQSTKWCLMVYPRGKHSGIDIACFLQRKENGPQEIVLNAEISFCGLDDIIIRNLVNERFQMNVSKGFPTFAKRYEVFAEKRTCFLPDDILTVRCRLWRYDADIVIPEQHLSRTRFELVRKLIIGTVKYFSSTPTVIERNVDIASETKEKNKCRMTLYLKHGGNSDENLMLQIIIPENQPRKCASCKVYLLDAERNKLEIGKSRINLEAALEWKFQLSPTLWKLMANKNLYLPDDTLTLECQIIISTGVLSTQVKHDILPLPSPIFNVDIFQDLASSSSALKDFYQLYQDEHLCDITIKINTEEFPAHKAFLAARSSVFKKMFTNNMKEKTNACVEIVNVDSETFRRMLLYVYTNKTGELEWDTALQLYKAANFFQIMGLRKECTNFLKKFICSSKACELVILADTHAHFNLKKFVQNYISQNFNKILSSGEWKDLEQNNFKLHTETLTQIIANMKAF